MLIKHESIERLEEKVDFVNVINHYTSLKKKGANYVGCCPFHDEKTPSFTVSPTKNLAKCFGCGESAIGPINFLMKKEKLSWYDAVKFLADRINFQLEYEKIDEELQAKIDDMRKNENIYRKILQATENQYINQLRKKSIEHYTWKELLENRELSKETIHHFNIGFAPNDIQFITRQVIKKHCFEDAEKAGVVASTAQGKKYDSFINRLIFPIYDEKGNILSFGGQNLSKAVDEDGKPKYAKYKNGAESLIFKKEKVLYGLHLAKNAILKENCVYIAEGYYDVLSAHNAKITNTVSTSGTSFSRHQAKILSKWAREGCFVFDGDKAGYKALLRSIPILLDENMHATCVIFDEREDLDDFCREHKEDTARLLSEKKEDALLWAANHYSKIYNEAHLQQDLIENIALLLIHVQQKVIRDSYCYKIAEILGRNITQETLNDECEVQLKEKAKKQNKNQEKVELPDNLPYTLPKYIDWTTEIYESIKNYHLFQHNSKIYIARSAGSKLDESTGDEIKAYIFKPISNFSVEILQHMEDEAKPMRLVRIRNVKNRERIFECLSASFSSLGQFKLLVEGWGNYSFTGLAADYEKLKTMLMDKMGDGRMINVLGWQHEGFFAFNNAAVNKKILSYNKFGAFEYKKTQYYVPSANAIYKNNQTKFINQKLVNYIDSGINFEKWCNQVNLVHREHSYIAVTFAIACIFSDYIFNYHKFFPMIFLYGEASSGKSKLVESIQTLFGKPQSPMTITGKANTDKAKIRKFAQFNNMLVFLEEYKNSVPEDVIEMLKGLWNRYGYERGNIESAYGTDTVPISSGVVITGNDYPTDDPLLTRLIIDELMKSSFTEEEKENFNVLTEMMNKGYSSIIHEIVQHRDYFTDRYKKTYLVTKKEINRLFWSYNGIDDRMIENISVISTCYKIMHKKLNFSFTYDQLTNKLKNAMLRQNDKRDGGGEVAKFWDIIMLLIREYAIKYNEDFRIDGKYITLFYSRTHPLYFKKHFDTFKMPGSNKNTLLDKLKKHVSFVEMKNSCRFGKNKSSGIVFNINLLDSEIKSTIISLIMRNEEEVDINERAKFAEFLQEEEVKNKDEKEGENNAKKQQEDVPF